MGVVPARSEPGSRSCRARSSPPATGAARYTSVHPKAARRAMGSSLPKWNLSRWRRVASVMVVTKARVPTKQNRTAPHSETP